MQAILSVTVPFFALILAGYWAAQRGWLPLAAIPGLNTFVLFFALPCMLLRFGMNTPLAQLLDPVISSLYLVVAALVVTGVLILGRVLGTPRKDAAFAALVAAFPNSGFIGVPLLVALLGPAAAGPVICTMLLDMMLTTSACLALAQGGGPSRSANTAPGAHANSTAADAARERNNTAPMVNKATGLAASASMPTALSTGPHRARSSADMAPP
ncbi:MAG: AEC family transporter, partial [Betaproteobacteria bacterium]